MGQPLRRRARTLSGVAIGVSTDAGASVEFEHLHAGMRHDKTSVVGGAGADIEEKLSQEFVRADERIGTVLTDSLFVNGYCDPRQAGFVATWEPAGGLAGSHSSTTRVRA